MPRLLLVDNRDSFTWNLAHAFERLGVRVEVVDHERPGPPAVLAREFRAWVVSPGPGRPEDAGATPTLVVEAAARGVPLLGVCLGHQALAATFGARIVRGERPMHGKVSSIRHRDRGLCRGVPQPFEATRYHSLVVDPASLPFALRVDARAEDGAIMALAHRTLPLYGVQFHPESVRTPDGPALLARFLELAAAWVSRAAACRDPRGVVRSGSSVREQEAAMTRTPHDLERPVAPPEGTRRGASVQPPPHVG